MAKNHVKDLEKVLNLIEQVVTIVKNVQVEIGREQARAESIEKSGEA
jgi:hypothetical protein